MFESKTKGNIKNEKNRKSLLHRVISKYGHPYLHWSDSHVSPSLLWRLLASRSHIIQWVLTCIKYTPTHPNMVHCCNLNHCGWMGRSYIKGKSSTIGGHYHHSTYCPVSYTVLMDFDFVSFSASKLTVLFYRGNNSNCKVLSAFVIIPPELICC